MRLKRNSLSKLHNLITLGIRVYSHEGPGGTWRRLQIYGDILRIKMPAFFTRIFGDVPPKKWGKDTGYAGTFEKNPGRADKEELSKEVRHRYQNPYPASPMVSIIILVPPHLLSKAYSDLGIRKDIFPIAETIATSELSLPIGPHLSLDHVEYIADAILSRN